ncbi:general substrate transporter [Pelagophyceae sp. CCMP2097]|nr:general substrate transporter [Pelagophyceae sp. CCMP2097]|mmetsp:Transcript_4183/g.14678  ORF Transcript_4183/g.14678 Transcript_4183/m.14678 type:complete len:519 (+) Transcript_4183:66-1622(+)
MAEVEAGALQQSLLGSKSLCRERNAFAILCALSASVAAIMFGFSLGFSSPALPAMEGDVFRDVVCGDDDVASVSSNLGSLWSAIINVGAMLGAAVSGNLLERLGRKGTILTVAAPAFGLGWAGTAVALGPATLLATRLLCGFAVGISSVVVPVYIAETAPTSLRGALGACNQLSVSLGIFAVYLVGLLLPHADRMYDCGASNRAMTAHGWRVLAWIGAASAGALFAVALFLPETPAWLYRHGKIEQAQKTLLRLRGGDDDRCNAELAELDPLNVRDAEMPAVPADVAKPLRFTDLLLMLLPKCCCPPGTKIDESVQLPLRITLAIMFFQQFSGINAVIFFSGDILGSSGFENRDLGGVIIMAIQVVFTGVSCLAVDRLGRRTLLVGSLAGMAVSAAFMAAFFFLGSKCPPIVALVALVGYIISFSMGLGPIPWLLMAELLPSKARGLASALATLANWSFSFIITESFATLQNALTPAGTFAAFTGVCAAGAVYVYTSVPETKGVSLEDIERLFASRSS